MSVNIGAFEPSIAEGASLRPMSVTVAQRMTSPNRSARYLTYFVVMNSDDGMESGPWTLGGLLEIQALHRRKQ